MRQVFRIIVTVLWTALAGLFIFTLQTIASEMGWVEFIQGGWRAVVHAGYADWVRWGVILFGGATLALWIDYILRRIVDNRTQVIASYEGDQQRDGYRGMAPRDGATFVYCFEHKLLKYHTFPIQDNIHYYSITRFNQSLHIDLVFESAVEEGLILVSSNVPGIEWQELGLSSRVAFIELRGNLYRCVIKISVVPKTRYGVRQQEPWVWHQATQVGDQVIIPPPEAAHQVLRIGMQG